MLSAGVPDWPYGSAVITPGAGPSEQLPLFPLGTVLTPGMSLSLHIFEPRYRQLVADLLNERDPRAPEFGVVALRGGSEVGKLQDVHQVGTTARVTDVLPLPDGRCNLSAVGERRFVIEELDTAAQPYLVGTVRWLAEPDGELSATLVLRTRLALRRHQQALAQLNVGYLEPTGTGPGPAGEPAASPDIGAAAEPGGLDQPLAAPPTTDPAELDSADAREVSYLAARQPWLPLLDRQRLLACPDTAARLHTARAVLRREAELVSQLRAVPISPGALRS